MGRENRSNNTGSRVGVGRKFMWLVCGVVVLVLAVLAWGYQAYQAPPRTGRAIDVHIAPGENTAQIAREIQALGLIRNAFLFRLYVNYRHVAQSLKAGHYRIAQGTHISEIVYELAGGTVVADTVEVTIPEGYTVQEIAARMQTAHVCSQAAFLHAVETGKYTESFLRSVPGNHSVRYRLEGYLFPDTYQFKLNDDATTVVDTMLQNFEMHVKANILPEIAKEHRTLQNVITVASMIEGEARVNAERPIIASVIENRLHHQPPMKLQIDATILYALGHRNVVTDKDVETPSPYNTYLHFGLPPGPIGNPGTASIVAALHPAKTRYLFYVVKNDGTGHHYFAETYSQQLANERKSQENYVKATAH